MINKVQTHKTLKKEGYKKTKIGWIPEKWETRKLSSICRITSGGTPNRKIPEYWNGTIPWITTSLINFNNLHSADEFITQEGLNNSSAKLFDPGTILIALYGQGVTRGKSALLKIKATTNQACAALIPQKNVLSEFLFQLLIFNYRRLRWISNDGSQKNLSGKLLKKYTIPFPPLTEQKKIAEILSTWDEAIQKTEALIKKKERLKNGLMQQLLHPKEHWQKFEIRELFSFHRSISASRNDLIPESNSNDVLNIHYGDVHTLFNDLIQLDISESDNLNAFLDGFKLPTQVDYAKDGDVIVVDASEDYEGVAECFELTNIGEKAVTAGLHTFLLRPKVQKTVPGFRSLIFKSPLNRKEIKRLVTGSNVFGLSKSNLSKLEVSIPPKGEQERIVNALSYAEREIKDLIKIKEQQEFQKKGLMQQLLTGKTRVKVK